MTMTITVNGTEIHSEPGEVLGPETIERIVGNAEYLGKMAPGQPCHVRLWAADGSFMEGIAVTGGPA